MSILNTYPQLGNIRDSDLVVFSAPSGLTKSGAPRDVFVVPYSGLKNKVATDLKGDSFFAGGELQFGSRFPSVPNNKDIFVFNSSASSLSNYVDTDGTSPISTAVSGDVAQWNGRIWVKRGRINFGSGGGNTGGGGGNTVALGAGQVYKFQLPTIAQQTLTAVTANTPVEYNIASFTADAGNPSPAVLSASAVSNVGRITVTQAGYINFSFEEEVQIDSSSAGGSGQDGELTWMVEQRSSDGTKLRGWTGEHSISDPITTPIKFPISRSIGIVPVSENDYFIVKMAFNSAVATRNVRFQLPSDNPNLEERFEFIYFPTASITGGGGGGIASELESVSTLPSTTGKSLGDIVNYKGELYELVAGTTDPHIYRGVIGDGPSGGDFLGDSVFEWDGSNIRVNLLKSVLGGTPPSKIFIQFHSGRAYNETGIVRSSGSDTSTTYRYVHDPTEPDLPTTSPIKKGDPFDVGFYTTSSLTTGVAIHSSSNRWEQDRRNQFTGITIKDDGTAEGTEDTITSLNFTGDGVSVTRADNSDEVNVAVTGGSGGGSETAEQIKSKLETLSGPDRLDGSAVKDAQFISKETTPTDLTPYVNGQVLRVQPPPTDADPSPAGEWLEIRGADAGKLHSFGADFVADPNNPAENTWVLNSQISYGVSFTTSRFGNLYTADRGKPYTASNAPVRSMIIELTVSRLPSTGVPVAFTSSLTCTIPKSELASAPTSIWVRFYDGPPGSGDEVDTVEMVKSADNPAHTYHTYTEKTGSSVTDDRTDILSIKYFNLFTASPQTSDQTSNPLELHSAKTLVQIARPQVIINRPTNFQVPFGFTIQRRQDITSTGNNFGLGSQSIYKKDVNITFRSVGSSNNKYYVADSTNNPTASFFQGSGIDKAYQQIRYYPTTYLVSSLRGVYLVYSYSGTTYTRNTRPYRLSINGRFYQVYYGYRTDAPYELRYTLRINDSRDVVTDTSLTKLFNISYAPNSYGANTTNEIWFNINEEILSSYWAYAPKPFSDGSVFVLTNNQSVNGARVTDRAIKNWKFYRYLLNSNKTDANLTQVELDSGVTLPSDFPTYLDNWDRFIMNGNSFLFRRGSVLWVLYLNLTTNKITRIRKLTTSVDTSATAPFSLDNPSVQVYMYQLSETRFLLLKFVRSTGNSNSINKSLVVSANILTIGENIDIQKQVLSSRIVPTLSNGGSYYYYRNIIRGTNYSYILICSASFSPDRFFAIKIRNSDFSVSLGGAYQSSTINERSFENWYYYNNGIELLDKSILYYGNRRDPRNYYRVKHSVTEDTSHNIATESEIHSLINPSFIDVGYQPSNFQYWNYDYQNTSSSNYSSTLYPYIATLLNDGTIIWFISQSLYKGYATAIGNAQTLRTNVGGWRILKGISGIPFNGAITRTISRRLIDSDSFSLDNAVFIRDELQSLTGDDRLNATALKGIDLRDIETPRRVTTLPDEDDSQEGDRVWVEADYTTNNGVNITPQSFAGTELDPATDSDAAAGIGSRGWYAKADAGFTFGEIHPPLPDDFVLISDQRVYVKRNTQTNLSKLHIGSTEYTLTRTAQAAGTKLNSNPAYASHLPDVDYYTISGGLPDEDWDDLRFETTTAGTFIPAGATITKGLYEFKNNDWSRAGFYAPPLDPSKPFKIAVEEDRPGTRADKNLAFVASGSTFTNTAPFTNVLRLTYNGGSADTNTYQRWTVFVDLEGGQPSKTPSRLKIGSVYYSFSYFETDAGQAVYRTPVVATAQRVASARTVNAMNVQWDNGEWAGQTGETSVLKTINKETLESLSNALKVVHSPPFNPKLGQRIEMLNDLSISGGAVMTAKHGTGGPFIGYAKASIVTAGAYGTLVPDNENFVGLQSFANQASAGNEANTTSFTPKTGYTANLVSINGINYTLKAVVNRQYYPLNGLDGSFLRDGQKYYVNVRNSSNQWMFPNVTLQQGRIYSWDGIQWVEEKQGLEQSEVDARVRELTLTPALKATTTEVLPANRVIKEITQTAYDALSTKEAILYGIPATSE